MLSVWQAGGNSCKYIEKRLESVHPPVHYSVAGSKAFLSPPAVSLAGSAEHSDAGHQVLPPSIWSGSIAVGRQFVGSIVLRLRLVDGPVDAGLIRVVQRHLSVRACSRRDAGHAAEQTPQAGSFSAWPSPL